MAIDWNWPIEFMDHTPAWVAYDQNGIVPGLVIAAEKPFGVPMAPYEQRGLYSLLTDENDSRIQNVDLPSIRFEDGTEPSGGRFRNPTTIEFRSAKGFEWHRYFWPSYKPYAPGFPSLVVMNRAALQREQQAAAEAEEMESNAHLVGILHETGKISYPQHGESAHGEVYAELYEQGIRYMVCTARLARKGGCINEYGTPVRPHDAEFWATAVRVRNVDRSIDLAPMETMQNWGLFA
jgi:hypothetical protein